MAKLRNSHGICPPEVLKFILDLFKYNDNSKNTFSDNYYRAALIDALGETVTPVVSMVGSSSSGAITAETISPDTKLLLEEISRYLNLEKLLPTYKFTVTTACLRAIRKLQKTGHLPSNSRLFKDYAKYSQFIDIRLVALECFTDLVRTAGTSADINHLLDMATTDPVPMVRHKVLRYLIENPPFDRNRRHKNDRPELVERIWKMMNETFWYDSRLRCDAVDLYFELYGRKNPSCLPLPELAALQPKKMEKPPKEEKESSKSKSSAFTIPKAEKRKAEEISKIEPIAFVEPESKRQQVVAEVPDYFAEEPVPEETGVPFSVIPESAKSKTPEPSTSETKKEEASASGSGLSSGSKDKEKSHKHHKKEKKSKKEKKKHKKNKHKNKHEHGDKEKKKHKKDKKHHSESKEKPLPQMPAVPAANPMASRS